MAKNTHGPGIDDPLIMRYDGADYFYHKNHLGSITEMTDINQNTLKTYDYDAYGNILSESGSLSHNAFTYTAREYHPRSGLYYYRARFYDPELGRFITQDPIGYLGGVNLYAYVVNDPVSWTDPFGLLQLSENGLEFIKRWEKPQKFPCYPYNDPAGNATIGWGHLLHRGPVTDADKKLYKKGITEDVAVELLKQDVAVAEKAVNRLVTVTLTQNQFDAIVSFTFNFGEGALLTSDLLEKLNNKEFDDIASELNRWIHITDEKTRKPVVSQGLVNRRKAEGELFNKK